MENFTYGISTRIYFGRDALHNLEAEIPKRPTRWLLVYGGSSAKRTGVYDDVTAMLRSHDVTFRELSGVCPNPRLSSVREGVRLCRENDLQFILGIGGGSALDCAKAVAAGVPYQKDTWDLFTGKGTVEKALPVGTILTIAGTGSEMNGNAVITNTETVQKLSIRSDHVRPQFSILDPTYTFTVPRDQTAAGVVDICSHILEQYFSPTPDTFLQDRLAESLLRTVIRFGPVALREPNHYAARATLMWASSLALNGLLTYGKVTDWATHAIEHKVSAVTDVTHAVGLAILTPFWMEYVRTTDPADRFVEYAQNVWGIAGHKREAIAAKGIEKTRSFFTSLGMPTRLREVGVKEDMLEEMAASIVWAGEIGKFRRLGRQDVYEILRSAF